LPTEATFVARLAALETEVQALEMTELRCVAEVERRGSPGAASSMLKIKATELSQQITEVALEAAAYYGQPFQPETNESHGHITGIGPDAALTTSAFYFNNRAASIYGGSNEIQRNIIAKAVLGL
jgi:alkylation response protein AidB-like acyl-CoA dehydrogenase